MVLTVMVQSKILLKHAGGLERIEGGENVDLASSVRVVGEDRVLDATTVLASWSDCSAGGVLEDVLDILVGQTWTSALEESDGTSSVWARHRSSRQNSVGSV